jgi:hypothetical protein
LISEIWIVKIKIAQFTQLCYFCCSGYDFVLTFKFKDQLLKFPHAFSRQVCDWIGSVGMKWELVQNDEAIFQSVAISTDSKVRLILKLIDLENWQYSETSKPEFLQYSLEQSSFRARGIQCVVLWEDLWLFKRSMVISRLSALLGISHRIPGRLTAVRRIDKNTATVFLEANHLQGSVSSKIRYGLYLPARYYRVLNQEDKMSQSEPELLVAVATFSHPRIFRYDETSYRSYELIRFCNVLNTTVVGGMAKLLKAFQNDFNPGDIMTYADLEWSDGAGYRKLDFKPVSDKAPIWFWLDTETLVRRSKRAAIAVQAMELEVCNQGSRKFVKRFDVKESE